MQFPESWLREFCNPPLTTEALADTLTMAGLEVEELERAAPPFSRVVVAEILTAEPHPNADRLRVCRVDAGPHSKDGPLQIVCGAPNARAGLKVPLALVGAELPPGEDGQPFRIKLGKLRGVESQGMLCSARELKLTDDHAGLLELDPSAPVGQDLRDWLKLDDALFTLKLTPNLGHALSVQGIAREVAALTGAPLTLPPVHPVAPRHDARLPVTVEATDLCGRFAGRIVRGVNPKAATPAWMAERLARCGQRSVSPLVDISNYVMFECGQPSHIFDLAKIHGGLTVRWGRPGEQLRLLNGNTVELDAQVGVIADDREVESLAGIMGGDATAVSDDTRDIYVEAAFWWPDAIAGRGRRYGFSTDAGHRFERGVDPEGCVLAIERITALILEVCGGEAGPIDDQRPAMPHPKPVTLRVARAAKVIGMPVSQADCAGVMRKLGLAFEEGEGVLRVTPPSRRFDLAVEEDLIEEVIRVLGYDRLPATPPRAPVTALPQDERRRSRHALRHAIAARDYQETIGFSFVEERWERELAGNHRPIRVLNPIAAPLAVMRSNLLGSLLQALRHNLARRAERVRLFEVGRVFHRDPAAVDGPFSVAGVRQPMRVGGLAWGPAERLQWATKERHVDFFDVKGDVEALLTPAPVRFVPAAGEAAHPALHPGRAAWVEVDGQRVGFLGELHPRWRLAYELPSAPVLFELDLEALLQRPLPAFQPLPKQLSTWRDLAVVAPQALPHDAVVQAIVDADPLLRSVRLFDVWQPAQPTADIGPGEHSLALRLELRDDEATLTDERIEAAVRRVITQLSGLGARPRG